MTVYSENSNLSIRHFRAALAVASEGTFAAAAETLSTVPSALTETIRQIESSTGVRLFDRRRRPVSVTASGSVFLEEARDVVSRFDSSLRRLRQVGGLQAGNVAVAVAPSLLQRKLAPVLGDFRSRYPAIGITVIDDVAGKVADIVGSGDADFGVAARWRDTMGMDYLPCGSDRFGLACHASHPLAHASGLRLGDIDPAQIISLGAETGIAQMIASSAAIPDRLRTGQLVAHSTIAQLLMVAQNLGVALLPEYAAGVLGNQQIVFRHIDDLDLARSHYLLRRSAMSLSPAASALFAMLQGGQS